MRAFLALPIPDAVADALGPVLDDVPRGRAVEPDRLHLTLAFLGEQPDDLLETAHHALEAGRWALPPLRLRGLGTFGDPPATLWAGVEPPAPLRALHDRLLALAHGAGMVVERRRYRPHVTLARLRPDPAGDAALARFLARREAFPAPPFQPDALVLYRSTLRKAGAVHDELARYDLFPAPPPP